MARAKDVGAAMAFAFVDQWMQTHPVGQDELLALKRTQPV